MLALTGCSDREVRSGHTRLTERYGPGPRQQGRWSLPVAGRRLPVVLLLHGGYWQPRFGPDLEQPVAHEAARRGFAVWNVDYRAADVPWPATFHDAVAALDHLPRSRLAPRLDLDRLAVVGHSAGGHLALWLAGRQASSAVRLAVGQAPVADLVTAARLGLGGGAVVDLMDGAPDAVPARYRDGSPIAMLPGDGTRVLLVHGRDDSVVPVAQSEAYAGAARRAGADVRLAVRPEGDHFAHLDPASPVLDPVWAELARL